MAETQAGREVEGWVLANEAGYPLDYTFSLVSEEDCRKRFNDLWGRYPGTSFHLRRAALTVREEAADARD